MAEMTGAEVTTDVVRGGIDAVNAASPFNRHFGFEVASLGKGTATIRLQAMPEALNHAGTLHAGVTAALLDTVAGYAAATLAGGVVTVGLNVSYIAAARGQAFEARAEVARAGGKQVFVDARLYAVDAGEMLVGSAAVILTRL